MSSMMEFGIDLGTTNSCVMRCEGEAQRVFQNNDLMNVTPSAVYVRKDGRLYVGKRAHNAIIADPEDVAIEFKRKMGRKDPTIFPASGRQMSPEELSAENFGKTRRRCSAPTGPAYPQLRGDYRTGGIRLATGAR